MKSTHLKKRIKKIKKIKKKKKERTANVKQKGKKKNKHKQYNNIAGKNISRNIVIYFLYKTFGYRYNLIDKTKEKEDEVMIKVSSKKKSHQTALRL